MWLVKEMKDKHGGLEGMPYLHALESLLDEKEEEIWHGFEAAESWGCTTGITQCSA